MTTKSSTRIVSTFHPASSVRSSCQCRLGKAKTDHLVVLNPTNIHVYSVQDHGLELECSTRLWGQALSVKAVPVKNSDTSTIAVLLDHPEPELLFLSYSEPDHRGPASLDLLKSVSLLEQGQRISEYFNDVLIDSEGRFALVSVYAGRLKLVQLKNGMAQDEEQDIPIPEINILALQLVEPSDSDEPYNLIILHLTHTKAVQLSARELYYQDAALQTGRYSTIFTPTLISQSNLPTPYDIPFRLLYTPNFSVNGSPGGILVVGGLKILLFALNSPTAQRRQDRKRGNPDTSKRTRSARQITKEVHDEVEKHRKPDGSVQWPFAIVTAVCSISGKPLTWLIGDTFGKFTLLSLEKSNPILTLVVLGETSAAESITYIANQIVFVGSSGGDSQLVEISGELQSSSPISMPNDVKTVSSTGLATGKETEIAAEKGRVVVSDGSYLKVKRTFQSLSPISDAVLVNLDDARHNQIVTCSGRDNSGSLNIVRMGTDLRVLATIADCQNIMRVWPLRRQFDETAHHHIVMSTLVRTFVLRVHSNSKMVAEESQLGFISNCPTLFAGNILDRIGADYNERSHLAIQVTAKKVYLLQHDMVTDEYERIHEWTPSADIIAASSSNSQVLIALEDGWIKTLRLVDKELKEAQSQKVQLGRNGVHGPEKYHAWWPDRISCVTCIPLDTGKHFSSYVAAAFWHSNQVKVYNLSTQGSFDLLCETPCLKAPVKSLLFYNFGTSGKRNTEEYKAFLLVGLVDGTLASFKWSYQAPRGRAPEASLTELKIFSVGHGAVSLSPVPISNGTKAVMAVADKAVVISCPTKRLHISSLTLQGVNFSCPYHTDDFPNSSILTTRDSLIIGVLDDLTSIHIQSFPTSNYIPLRIVQAPSIGFGVVFKTVTPARVGNPEEAFYCFRLLDENHFKLLSQWDADQEEVIASTTTMQVDGIPGPLFVVATYKNYEVETQPSAGRILVFAYENSQLNLLATIAIDGCPIAVTTINGLLAAAVNASVQLFRLSVDRDGGGTTYSLNRVSQWSHFYNLIGITSSGDRLMVADALQSLSILQLGRNSGLDILAKDYSPLWPVSIDACGENDIVGVNDSLNLFSYTVDNADLRPRLTRNGFFNFGEMVTKFVRGHMTPDVSAPLKPTHLFFTSSGTIGVITSIEDDALAQTLSNIQQKMSMVISGVGGTSHAKYRAPKTTLKHGPQEPSYGFLDGDFLEQLLPHFEESTDVLGAVFDGESVATREEFRKVIENLQTVHL